VHADEINEYLREISGEQMTAKDFRTWHGTVRAAEELAAIGPLPTQAKRKKAVSHAMKEVAELLGNTPTVARASYVDPRIVEAYQEGRVVDAAPDAPPEKAEAEVLELLSED
jgi:DNA topoisomerase-1